MTMMGHPYGSPCQGCHPSHVNSHRKQAGIAPTEITPERISVGSRSSEGCSVYLTHKEGIVGVCAQSKKHEQHNYETEPEAERIIITRWGSIIYLGDRSIVEWLDAELD
jgi:hypothetical protein